jgi:hypothetical protein
VYEANTLETVETIQQAISEGWVIHSYQSFKELVKASSFFGG